VSILTFFGLISVSTMLIAYALEERSRAFVLLFASACAASSAYGFLAGTWPFGIVEAVWTAVALRRWATRKATGSEADIGRPIACNMSALSAAERRRYDSLRSLVLKAVDHVVETPIGFHLRIGSSASIADVAEWMEMEHRCCAFLDINLSLGGDGTTWIEIGGSAAIKVFLREEFSAFRGATHERPAINRTRG
jgi:hypothetical protein